MNENAPHSSLMEIPYGSAFVEPTLDFVCSYAQSLGVTEERRQELRAASRYAFSMIENQNREGASSLGRIGVEVRERDGKLIVEVVNRGVPIFLEKQNGSGARFFEVTKNLDQVSLENRGREGQSFVFGMRLGEHAARRSIEAEGLDDTLEECPEIVVQELQPGEDSKLSQLFFHVYGYDYIHEYIYYPEKIAQMRQEGRLISIVAVTSTGQVVAHVGLVRSSEKPLVYEPCLGLVDPRLKSKGLFGQVFDAAMKRLNELNCQYCYFDFVTNHDRSQRFVHRYNPADLAIFVGCQSKSTQARLERLGMGQDPTETDRYSLLYSVLPRVEHPFGTHVSLPNNLGEMLGFLLKPLNLKWQPSARFEQLAKDGEHHTKLQPNQNAVIFEMGAPGRSSLDKILAEWAKLLRSDYEYAAVDVPVDRPGLAHVYDKLAANGFFVAGFVPYRSSERLAIRFQAMGLRKLSFDEIKVYSPTAKALLDVIRSNHERNRLQ
jgi:hypothetical protein